MRRALALLLMVGLLVGFIPVYGQADEAAPTLTIDQAIKQALDNQKDLRQSELDVQSARIAMDKAWDDNDAALWKTYNPATGMYVSVATGADPQGAVYSTHSTWLTKTKSYDAKVDTVVLTTYQKYFGVITAIDNLEYQKLTSQQDTEKARIAGLNYQVGLATATEYDKAKMQASASQSSYTSAQQSLDQAYRSLLLYIGMAEDIRPVLDSRLQYTPVEINDPEAMISNIANNSPTVYSANQAVVLAGETYGMGSSYDVDEITKEKASLSLQSAVESMRTLTRSYYIKLKGYEDSFSSTELALKIAQDGQRITKLKYDLGMATKADLMTAETTLSSARNTYNNLIFQHEIYNMAFNKPWAYSGS
ncbi:MAG: TolC family protein [Syntrophomonadaceae bacterium]